MIFLFEIKKAFFHNYYVNRRMAWNMQYFSFF
jgi:hypothetical protein